MSISNEIKRMMFLLESELGNVKPLITEEGEPPIEVLDSPLKRAVNVGCWTKKGYTVSDPKIYQLGKDYLYAFSRVAPAVQAGDSFMKIATPDGRDLYMFEIPSTDPVALAKNPKAYLAVNRTAVVASNDPNLNYLSAHGWYCDEFNVTQNLASQQNNLTADQQQQIDILLSALGTQDTGYSFFKTKPEDGRNYVKIDLATGTGDDGVNYIDKFNLSTRIGPFKSQPNKFFIWSDVGTQEKLYDIPAEVESFLSTLGFTRTRPKPGTAEIRSETTLKALCDGQGQAYCDPAVMDYIKTDAERSIWRMSPEQAKVAGNVSYKDMVAQQKELGRGGSKQGLRDLDKQKANKPACQAAIQQLSNCEKYGTDEDCAEALELAFTPDENGVDPSYAQKLDATKKLVKTCVQNEVSLGMFSKNLKAQLSQLQGSTSPYGLRVATTQTPRSLEESLNNSIKSVISETINKNNNKNLDSIIKKNLRKYIR
jgi:hypothetical protein